MAIVSVQATVTTTNATETQLWASPVGFTGGVVAVIHAHHAATGDQRQYWQLGVRSDVDNETLDVGVYSIGDAGGSVWVCTLEEGTNVIRIMVTGEASHTITWTAAIEYWN